MEIQVSQLFLYNWIYNNNGIKSLFSRTIFVYIGNPLTDFGGLDGKIKNEHSNSGNGHSLTGNSMSHPHQGMFLNESMMAGAGFPNFSSTDMLNNMEITSLLSGTPSTSQTSEKSNKRSSKRKASEDLWKNPKRKAEDNDMLMESSSSDSNSVSTPMSQEAASEIATPNSALGFHSDLELSGLDATELITPTEKGMYFNLQIHLLLRLHL